MPRTNATILPRSLPSLQSGFTLVEILVSVVILTLLVGVVLSISVETARLTNYADADHMVQTEAQRSFTRLADVLRKTGWTEIAEVTYPQVWNDGTELDFLLNGDLDGNGFAYALASGEVEWSPLVYSVRLDAASNTLGVYSGPYLLWVLGRDIAEVGFATYIEDPTVHFNEIRITIRSTRVAPDGTPLEYTFTKSVHMRN